MHSSNGALPRFALALRDLDLLPFSVGAAMQVDGRIQIHNTGGHRIKLARDAVRIELPGVRP